ncbi:MAG: hypothetical protein IPL79_16185 [Myxococcales bacterium]|nr:hypothetical protein [Myxococcales bacterium]
MLTDRREDDSIYVPAGSAPINWIDVQTILHFLLRFGQGATTDPTLARLLGRPARGVGDTIADSAALWLQSP